MLTETTQRELPRVDLVESVKTLNETLDELKTCLEPPDPSVRRSEKVIDELRDHLSALKKVICVAETKTSSLSRLPLFLSDPICMNCNQIHHFPLCGKSPPQCGIIDYLRRQNGNANVDDCGIVTVTAFSTSGTYLPKRIADLDTTQTYFSLNDRGENGQWVQYNFGTSRVKPVAYSIRTNGDGVGYAHLKFWVVEVSNDVTNWIPVDDRNNNSDLNGPSVTASFEMSNRPSEAYQYVRLRTTGKSHENNDHLHLSAFELYGDLQLFD
jgi:hypothetical protein